MGKRLVTVGDLVLDIILPVTLPAVGGQHQQSSERLTEPGGAANTIITALNLGLEVFASGAVGADVYGEFIVDALRRYGTNVDCVNLLPDSESTLVISLTDRASGEHVFIGHYGSGREMPYPDQLDGHIAAADILFLSGYTLVEKRIVGMAMRALEQAVRTNTPIFMDVGPLLEMADQADVRWVLRHTDTLFLTEDESPLVIDGRSGPEAYDRLLELGPEVVVLKRGPRGCTVLTRDDRFDVPGFQVHNIIDTVGAGDAFAAAYIAGVLSGLSLYDCALLANATGAAAIQKIGSGTNAPTCDEVMAVVDAAGESLNFSC